MVPSLKRHGPGDLYVVDAVTRVQRLRDLRTLGVSMADLETWTVALDHLDTRRRSGTMSEEEGQAVDAALSALQVRLDTLSHTTRRWRRLMTTLKRRFGKLRLGDAQERGKRRLRTRMRR